MNRKYPFFLNFFHILNLFFLILVFKLDNQFYFYAYLIMLSSLALLISYYRPAFIIAAFTIYVLVMFYFVLHFPVPTPYVFLPATILVFRRIFRKKQTAEKLNFLRHLELSMDNLKFEVNEMSNKNTKIRRYIKAAEEEIESNRFIYEFTQKLLKTPEFYKKKNTLNSNLRKIFPEFVDLKMIHLSFDPVTPESNEYIKKLRARNLYAAKEENAYVLYTVTSNVFIIFSLNKKEITESDKRLFLFIADLLAVNYENSLVHKRIKDLTIFDSLTGLRLRRKTDARLAEEMKRAATSKKPLSILMLDLDHFKRINDTHGHLIGDFVLKNAGDIIISAIRTDIDTAGRYGGEEFIVILPNTSLKNALIAAERIRSMFEKKKMKYKNKTITATVSIGAAAYAPGDTAKSLIEHADEALYNAKQNGRNRVSEYSN